MLSKDDGGLTCPSDIADIAALPTCICHYRMRSS